MACGTGVEPELHRNDSNRLKTWMVLVHRTDSNGVPLWEKTYTSNFNLLNDAGEYVIATQSGNYAVLVDSQTWGSRTTGGNFAIILLGAD